MRTLIKNGRVITGDARNTELLQGHVVVEDGRITAISAEPILENPGEYNTVIDATGKLVLPGLINGHIHSYASLVKATKENIPLEPWMLYVMTEGRCMEPEDVYWSVMLCSLELLKSGTTSCVDHLAQSREGLDAALQAYRDSGLRATVAPMISDKPYYKTLPLAEAEVPTAMRQEHAPSAQNLIDMTVALLKDWQGKHNRLRVMFGPSGPQRCSDELLINCARLAEEYDTGFHTHVLETRVQAATAAKFYGKPMVFHLAELGCLNHRTSLVHAVWLTQEEIQLTARHDATVVHNPASNLILGSGIAPVNDYRRHGVTVALGTDGANCGGNLNMFEAMKLGAMIHKVSEPNSKNWVTAREALTMATRNSARVSLQESSIGSLEVGKRADIIILDPARSPALVPLQNPVLQLVYSEWGQAVETVLVEGRVVLANGQVIFFDEAKVRLEAERRAEKIIERFLAHRESVQLQADYIHKAIFGC